jgi:hypothetical protein
MLRYRITAFPLGVKKEGRKPDGGFMFLLNKRQFKNRRKLLELKIHSPLEQIHA